MPISVPRINTSLGISVHRNRFIYGNIYRTNGFCFWGQKSSIIVILKSEIQTGCNLYLEPELIKTVELMALEPVKWLTEPLLMTVIFNVALSFA